MKKHFLFACTAIVALLMTACSEEDNFRGQDGNVVTFSVGVPQLATRAAGEETETLGKGLSANRLYWGVYDHESKLLAEISDTTAGKEFSQSGSVQLTLAQDKSYSIIFWAANADNSMCTVNWAKRTMTVNPTEANQEAYDAFCAFVEIDNVSGYMTRDVKLYRPFAQLNIGTADVEKAKASGLTVKNTKVEISGIPTKYYFVDGTTEGSATFIYDYPTTATSFVGEAFPVNGFDYLAMNYALVAADKELVTVKFTYKDDDNQEHLRTYTSVPVQRNWRTNIYGNILTSEADFTVTIEPEFAAEYNNEDSVVVNNAEAFVAAFNDEAANVIVLGGDINLNDLFGSSNAPATRAAGTDPSLTIATGKELTIDLNGMKLSATSTQSDKNYNMFDIHGTLTVKNGTMEYEHLGENMGWNSSTNLFNVTAGGVLNLEGVTAKNLGGSDMGFVAHLNNWGEVTLNVENSTLESNYVPVRVFNSGPDMNNVTIKNSTLKGGNYAFWVHNYTVEDFGTEVKAEAQKALLNINIYGQRNTFSPDLNGIRYGFTNSVKTDAYGITKVVSEDGTEVTLGSLVENGVVRRGVAGAEENTTITKVVVEEGVAVLYDRTFRRFNALETVVLPNSLTTIGAAGSGVFQSCTNLKNIVLPENVTVLGKGSFQECTSLESINIPAGVTRIESDALRNTGLKEVEFHAGVTYFGAQAFRDCKQLTKVVINAPEFTMEGNTFGIMAAPYTPMTIEVANAAMKAYVESKLTAHAKTYITVVSANTFVKNAAELQLALENVIDGGTITLSDNVTFDKDNYFNNNGWRDGLGYAGDKSFTIDLGGFTISQDGYLNDYLIWIKNVGSKANTITIKNGTLDAGTTAFCALCTASSHDNQLTINTEDLTLINNKSDGSTIKNRAGAILNVKSGTKIIGKNSYLGIECWKATVNIYDEAEIYMNGTSSYNGCLAGVGGNGTINVYGGYGKGVKGGFIAMTSGGTINIEGGEWIANTDGSIGDNSNLYVLTAQSNKYESGFAGPSIINVTGGTFRGGMDAWVLNNIEGEKAELNISGGNFNANPTSYLGEGVTVTEANGIWTVK